MFSKLPPVTLALLLTNVGVFLLQQLAGPQWTQWSVDLFALWPPGTSFQPWQIVTYAFLHENFLHILVNMFVLYMFGTPLERYWGSPRYTVFFFICVMTAALTQITVSVFEHSEVPALGASGGIFGLLLAFAMYFPRARIMLLFPPIPLPAWAFVTLYALYEVYQGVSGTESGVAHFAHLGGMLGAAAVILFWRAIDGVAKR